MDHINKNKIWIKIMYQISNKIPKQQQSLIPLSGVSYMEKEKKKDTQSKNKNNNCIHLILVFIPPKLDLATINRHVIKVITILYFYLLSFKHETSFRF